MAKSPKANRHKEATTGTKRSSGIFNSLMAGSALWGVLYFAGPSDEKPEDKTAHSNPVSAALAKIPDPVRAPVPAPTVLDEVPGDTQGIKPYADAPLDGEKIVAKALPNADGVIWENENGGPVKPSLIAAKEDSLDPIYEEALNAAAEELKKLKGVKESQNEPPTERIVSDEIARPGKSFKPQEEWVPIESLNKKSEKKIPSVKQNTPAIKRPVEKDDLKKTAGKLSTPKIITHTANSALPQFLKLNNNGDHVYTVGPKIVPVPDKVMKAFHQVAREKNLPIEVLIATCARESYCQPRQVNKDTKACGLFQFMPTKKEQTLFRVAYNYGPAHGYPQTRQLIDQTIHTYDKQGRAILHYAPKNAAAAKQLAELCLNEHFNTSMFGADLKHHIGAYEGFLKGKQPTGREAVIGEIVLINNLGPGGMQKLFEQVMKDKKSGQDTMARDFFKKIKMPAIGDQNPSLVKYPDTKEHYTDKNGKIYEVSIRGRDKTVRETYNLISEHGGWTPVSVLAPSRQL
jgi:hypothetical protein